MIYKLLTKIPPFFQQIVGRIDDDGIMRVTCTEDDQAYLAWVAQGNTPQPADEVTK
jgi:hypothetical protein